MPSPRPAVRFPLGKLTGFVTSVKMPKTVVVRVPYLIWNFKYQEQMKKTTKIWAHDEYELVNEGDVVRLKESRKLSKNKAHYVDAILRREDRTIDIPEPYPNAHRLVEDFVQDKTLKHKESAPEDSAPAA